MNPGPFVLKPDREGTWDSMLEKVRMDLPEIARVRAPGEIADRAQRNKVAFAWIERHRGEFGCGWVSLESRVFEWIMESCIPKDCWRATAGGTVGKSKARWRSEPIEIEVP